MQYEKVMKYDIISETTELTFQGYHCKTVDKLICLILGRFKLQIIQQTLNLSLPLTITLIFKYIIIQLQLKTITDWLTYNAITKQKKGLIIRSVRKPGVEK